MLGFIGWSSLLVWSRCLHSLDRKTSVEVEEIYPFKKLLPVLVDEFLFPYCTLLGYHEVDCERSMQEGIDWAIRHCDYPLFDKFWAVNEQVGS